MLPVVYTPTVGRACQQFSEIYRRGRGLFLAYPDRDHIDAALGRRPYRDVAVVAVTDGERVLGLGDLGADGMGIPIGRLALYTLCGGTHPARALPVLLDAGTDDEGRLRDPLYVGWPHPRVRGQAYDDFVEAFVQAAARHFPGALLQWEDFARGNAGRLLERYRDRLCTFNDDIQGTAAVVTAALLAAARAAGARLRDQRVVRGQPGPCGRTLDSSGRRRPGQRPSGRGSVCKGRVARSRPHLPRQPGSTSASTIVRVWLQDTAQFTVVRRRPSTWVGATCLKNRRTCNSRMASCTWGTVTFGAECGDGCGVQALDDVRGRREPDHQGAGDRQGERRQSG
jgi:hypothetical protein